LRLKQAIGSDDPDAVEAVTIQFYGTAAATHAHVWLGDRAMASGDFARAQSQYRLAAADQETADTLAVAARLRLAGAMEGHDVGQPVTDPVEIGHSLIEPDEFERTVAEMKARATSQPSSRRPSQAPWELLPAGPLKPHRYRSRTLGQLTLRGKQKSWPSGGFELDELAAETSLVPTSQALVVVTRRDLTAFDRTSGKQLWAVSIGSDDASWPLVPSRPTSDGSRLFVRRLRQSSCELLCVADGKLAWQSHDLSLASDPVVLGSRVLAATLARVQPEVVQLNLTSFDARTGQVLAERPLAQFRDPANGALPFQLSVAGDTLLAVGGGCVIGCNRDGEPRWLRRDTWTGGVIDRKSWPRYYDAPLVDGPIAYLAQPDVPAVSCVETAGGRLRWQRPLADLVRLVGAQPERLIVQTARGFAGLDGATGKTVWEHAVAEPLDGCLVDRSGRLLYTEREAAGNKRTRARLVWLDARDGHLLASTLLTDLRTESLMLGPLATDGSRLWMLVGAQREVARSLLELSPDGPAETMVEDPALSAWSDLPSTLGDGRGLLPGWRLLATYANNTTGVQFNDLAQGPTVGTLSTVDRPVRWLRLAPLSDETPARLRVRLASAGLEKAKVTATVDGEPLAWLAPLPAKPTGSVTTLEADLSPWQGKTVRIELVHAPQSSGALAAGWKAAEIVPVEPDAKKDDEP
jgi:outer membrane protein assembly factor BamB